jgi:hypothetical protein
MPDDEHGSGTSRALKLSRAGKAWAFDGASGRNVRSETIWERRTKGRINSL